MLPLNYPMRRVMETQGMSESRSIWSFSASRRARSEGEPLVDFLLAAAILIIMAVAQVQFLRHVAGPDTVNLIQAADGFVTPDQVNAGGDEKAMRF